MRPAAQSAALVPPSEPFARSRPHLSAMQEDDATPDNALVAAALEHPMSRYLEWAQRPDVAQALAMFKSEREIRKTGRLDLVTWVQYICAFGYAGPPDEAWAHLFAACRVLPMLQPNQLLLREHEIAVLLAFAKIKPDNGDSMTPAQLVKHRIKPAVLGRTVARTPGILQHIHIKFENWALGPFTDMFCSFCVSMCGPSSYMPGSDDLPSSLSDIGDSIRECADAHASSLLKTWGGVVTSILDIENDCSSARAKRFEQKLYEKRKFMYQHIFIKISEYYFNLTQARSYVPQDSDTMQYRQYSNIRPEKERILFVKDRTHSGLSTFIERVISSPSHRAIPAWGTVTAFVTICELHKPSRYGQAGLDFLQSDDIRTDVVKVRADDMGSGFTPSKASVRVGNFNSETLTVAVHGVPPNQMCRALRLELSVGVLPPKSGSTRPVFQVCGIRQATWVELTGKDDQCIERDPLSELGMADDEKEDEDTKDDLHQWCCASGIGKYLALGSGVHWETYDLCEGMTKHEMKIHVPEDVARRVRMQGAVGEEMGKMGTKREGMKREGMKREGMKREGMKREGMKREGVKREGRNVMEDGGSSQSEGGGTYGSCCSIDMDVDMKGGDGSETYSETCWIDCHAGARITYMAPPGIELYAATPAKKGMFSNAPYWKSRAP